MPRYGGRQKEFEHYFGVRLTKDLYVYIEQEAKRLGVHKGDIVRKILTTYFTQHGSNYNQSKQL